MTNDSPGIRRKRVLAIASGGGHWVQLLRLRPALAGCDVTYVTVNAAYAADVPGGDFRVINDATRWNKFGLLKMAAKIGWIIARTRPDVVLTTGAAPGFFAVRAGKILGARTVWLDSIANVERLSLSGERVGPHADLWLTQWPHLAGDSRRFGSPSRDVEHDSQTAPGSDHPDLRSAQVSRQSEIGSTHGRDARATGDRGGPALRAGRGQLDSRAGSAASQPDTLLVGSNVEAGPGTARLDVSHGRDARATGDGGGPVYRGAVL